MLSKHWLSLLVLILLTLIIASAGALFQPDIWFELLNKPLLMPANNIFAPVWAVLYILMTWAGWNFWCHTNGKMRKQGMFWYGIQLITNGLWTYLFFGLHLTTFTLIDTFILLFALFKTLQHFYRGSHLAAYLLVPYFLWVIFATYLTTMIWWLN